MLGDFRLTTVWAMACISSGRLCARVEKLCQLGHNVQPKRKISSYVKIKQFCVQPLTRPLVQNCQQCRLLFPAPITELDFRVMTLIFSLFAHPKVSDEEVTISQLLA
ncbi:hypothetical protein L9F63_008875, partial [Diploptera punctata]